MSIIIWIDREIYNEENQGYVKDLEQLGYKKLRLFEKIGEALDYMKSIQFEETKIIVSGRLFNEFINIFKANILDICFMPKIIVFTGNKKRFLSYNQDYEKIENKFYTYGGIATIIDEIKDFLNKENNNINKNLLIDSQMNQNDSNNNSISLINQDKPKEIKNNVDVQLTFEYIDNKYKLILPLFYKALIDKMSSENMEEYTKSLYNIYSKESKNIKNLLEQILMPVPIEILAKYYARLYTFESNIQKCINKDLRMNKIDKYKVYIKTFYEGVKLRSLTLSKDSILYRIGNLSYDEINKIKTHLKNKITGLPCSIVFSKTFLSFSKDESEAKKYLEYTDKKLPIVLFKLINDNEEEYNLSTHGDIEKISYYPNEKEVLFFPFSSFEIKDIQEINLENEKGYEITLLYLCKYLKYIENDKNIIINEDKIPDTEFKKQLCEFGLIEKEKIQQINIKTIYNDFKQYEKDINQNFIIGEINIKPDDINKNIHIINSYENFKIKNKLGKENDDWVYENDKEIKENIEIKINEKIVPFSYYHNFEKRGKYIIKYSFKNNLTNTNYMFVNCKLLKKLDFTHFNSQNVNNMSYMFCGCDSLTKLDFTNFNTQKVTNMSGMFEECHSLTNIDLSNFNTQNVINMNGMFFYCDSLTNLNLSNFYTQKVTNMNGMFYDCDSLTNLDLSKLNTQNVTDMSNMFYECRSLTNLDLSNFDTRNVTDMSKMFYECRSLSNLDLSDFDTQNVSNMSNMFTGCSSLTYLDLSNFNTQKVNYIGDLFLKCYLLKKENIVTKDIKILEKCNL